VIAEITTAALITCSPVGTRGASAEACFVDRQRLDGRRFLQNSSYFGFDEVFNDLLDLAKECKSANWDGQGALPVSQESYHAALKFLESLPLGAIVPSVGIEPDGEITMEWYQSPRRTLSISFSKNGEIHYAALLGASRAYGTEPFFGEIPKVVMDIVSRVMTA
jgi:hypothetical protein